jgi:dolichyl-phosphate beta-glucosyltransferase
MDSPAAQQMATERDEQQVRQMLPSISVIIPAFNEAHGIQQTLKRISDYFSGPRRLQEIVVVNDGSTDGTGELVRRFASENRSVRLITNAANRGKGYSVRQGMLTATGDLLLMCDADLSTPVEEFEKLLPWLQRGHDIVIASRDLPDSRLEPAQPVLRRGLAGIFRGLRRLMVLRSVRDTQCGFKLFRRDTARKVFAYQRDNGWLFDCEVLAVAERLGIRIKEVGVNWHDNAPSRVRVLRESLRVLPGLLRLRWRLGRIRT